MVDAPGETSDSGDLQKGDEVVVQVIKEGGTKGPTLSTYLSIPGRYLVLMPSLGRIGVSRKIEDDKALRVLRDILVEIDPPEGLGFIVRTAGMGRTKRTFPRYGLLDPTLESDRPSVEENQSTD